MGRRGNSPAWKAQFSWKRLSPSHGLAMADAIIYATAHAHQVTLITGDADFKDLPHVIYVKK